MTDHDHLERRVTALEAHVGMLAAQQLNVHEELRLDVHGQALIRLTNDVRELYARLERVTEQVELGAKR